MLIQLTARYHLRGQRCLTGGVSVEIVEAVALWAGLLTGVVATVLAVVSMIFTYLVDKRASEINTQIIQTLQKIESAVERTTDDTANLIKVAWERMLPQAGGSPRSASDTESDSISPDTARQIASGVAAELRAELNTGADDRPSDADLNEVLTRLQERIEDLLEATSPPSRDAEMRAIYRAVESLTPRAHALLIGLVNGRRHLEAEQYGNLSTGPMEKATLELRRAGLLIPLAGFDDDGNEVPVYWLPPRTVDLIRAMLRVVEPPPESDVERVRKELERIGYSNRSDSEPD